MRPGKKGALSPDQTTPARKAISSSAFNPFTHIESMEDYRAAWHDSGDSATAGAFPASIIDFQRQSNWYLAVNGRHPSVKTLQNDSTSCWITPASIDKGSFFGLNFLGSKPVHIVKVIGSANLGNIVGKGQEDLTAESWEVWTKQDDDEDTLDSDTREDKNEWSRRALRGKVISVRIGDSPLYVHSIALAPLVNYHTSVPAGNRENVHGQSSGQTVENGDESEEDEQILRKRDLHIEEAESDEATHDETNDDREKPLRALEPTDTSILSEAAPVTGIRFISRDRKSQPVKFCGFDIDGWIV